MQAVIESPGAAGTARGVATTWMRGDDMSERTCSIEGCQRVHLARGWCRVHYMRHRRTGSTSDRPTVTVADRFWPKVDRSAGQDSCWLWTAAKEPAGYGHFKKDGRPHPAHRVAYEMVVGPIPDGLDLDHLCRNPSCVNPAHLEPVTPRENTRRADTVLGIRSAATHCRQGHPLAEGNLRTDKSGRRFCRACHRIRQREYVARRRAE